MRRPPGPELRGLNTAIRYEEDFATTADAMQSEAYRPLGTAGRAILRRWLADLRHFDEAHGDRITRQMVECGEYLLIEDDRRQGGGNHGR